MFKAWFRRPRSAVESRTAYEAVVAQARRPEFYGHLGVPDSLDGRFEMIALHLFLVLHRLKGMGGQAQTFSRELTEALFADMDASLRELGVGDLSVPRRIRDMLSGFYGRVQAYEKGLDSAGDDHALRVALDNNLYGTVPSRPDALAAMAAYMRREAAALARLPAGTVAAGRISFGPPPEIPDRHKE